jgi:hypothetical protein
MQPGIHIMDAKAYHADPCPTPSLSSGILRTLLDESPLHAWHNHPRFNAQTERDPTREKEIGSVTHKLALDEGSKIVVLPFDSYQKKEPKELRAAAYAEGSLPILEDDYIEAKGLAMELRGAAEAYLGAKMADCLRERVITWQENGIWFRVMIDAMRKDLMKATDLKTVSGSAAEEACIRRIYQDGYDIQGSFYTRGLDAIDPDNMGRRDFAFCFGEQSAPHAVSPAIELSEAGLEMARSQVNTGIALWEGCLRTNYWPGYRTGTIVAEPPLWKLKQWEERLNSDETLNPPPDLQHSQWAALAGDRE